MLDKNFSQLRENQENKRKRDEDRNSRQANKRRNIDAANQTELETMPEEVNATEMMKMMYREVMGIKNTMNSVNEKIEQMQMENSAWRTRFETLEKNCDELKDSVELAHNLIQDDRKTNQCAIREVKETMKEQFKGFSSHTNVVNSQSGQIKTLEDTVRNVSVRLDVAIEEQGQISAPLQNMKTRIDEVLGNIDFPVKKTIVAQNVWYKENEDLFAIAKLIIHDTLDLPDIKIIRCECKSGTESGSGLIKIELENTSDVVSVSKNKQKLRDAPAQELRDIFIRPSRSAETLIAEKNEDTILREMGVRNEYVRLATGHLAKKKHRYHPKGGVRGGRGGGRGRGSLNRDRPRGQQYRSQRDNNSNNATGGGRAHEKRSNRPQMDVPIDELLK